MQLSVYLPLVFSGVFGLAAPALSRRLPPAPATWLLSAGGLLAAAATAAALFLLGFTLVAQNRVLAAQGHWADSTLQARDPVAAPVAAAALAVLAVLAVRSASSLLRRFSAVRAAHRLAAALSCTDAELVVLDSPDTAAFAVPGRPGRIVVSSGLLRRLDAGERRAVLAHERAHLARHHHLHQSAAHLAAAANPLLWRLPAQVAATCERWADEVAALGDGRQVVAAALTRAGTGNRLSPGPSVVLAGVVDVADRVVALWDPPQRLSMWRAALLLGLVGAATAAVAVAAHDTERLFELARAAYRAGLR
ncbi:MAG: hypothetical protein QOI76_3922 [Frankiales bacterium]|nr:hypothetical protein [Frankiales bacterium]